MTIPKKHQAGSSLIEVLVAVLILSFGMLALGGMLAYAVQLPKLSAYRAAAISLAASHVERMRANTTAFATGAYKVTMSYDGSNIDIAAVAQCAYPACTADLIATLDTFETRTAIRKELPFGGIRVICTNDNCNPMVGGVTQREGEMWVMWQEPSTFAKFDPSSSDECPNPGTTPGFTAFVTPKPRCVHIKFKL
jgi:type IV pilus assembly protein PilV